MPKWPSASTSIPAFQQNGQFAGQQVYEQVLRMQRPPLTTEEFEDNLRSALLVEKLRAAVTDWVAVSDADLEREYRQRNEKVKLQMVVFTPDTVQKDVTVTDAEVSAHFDKHKEQYRDPREAQDPVPARGRRRGEGEGRRARRATSSATTSRTSSSTRRPSRCARATSC